MSLVVKTKFLTICCFILCLFPTINGQDTFLQKSLSFEKTQVHISEILYQLAENGFTFTYKDQKDAENKVVSLKSRTATLIEVLDALAKDSKLCYKIVKNHIIIKPKKKQYRKITGFIFNAVSGEQLIATNIYNPKTFNGTTSNSYGFYSFSIEQSATKVRFSHVGYESYDFDCHGKTDTCLNVYLKPNQFVDEVNIVDENLLPVGNQYPGKHILDAKAFEYQAGVVGEKDVLKSIQLLPGIQPAIEGSTGLQVRGGSHFHNLIMIDDVPIYNIDHAFGFFSVFNADAIKTVHLYKGVFPARYGGRASSVLDIRMNEGNNEEFQFGVSTGLVMSKFKIEAPIVKQKSSFMISARHTNLKIPMQILDNKELDPNNRFGFYDIYSKFNYQFSRKHKIFLSLFYAKDRYMTKNTDQTSYPILKKHGNNLGWGNLATAFRWNWLLNDNFFSNTTITYSSYNYLHKQSVSEQDLNSVLYHVENKHNSKVKELAYKTDFDLHVNDKHYVKFGVGAKMKKYEPKVEGQLMMVSSESNNLFSLPEFDLAYDSILKSKAIETIEGSTYIEDHFNIGERFKSNLGFRYQFFSSPNAIYHSPEPRISIHYHILQNLALKAGYSRSSQHTHLLSSSFLVLPFNTWVPSTKLVQPQIANQFSVALDYFTNNKISFSLEAYYNTINNDILYKRGINTLLSWEQLVEQGKRRSYGIEVMANKQFGKITGWLTYTLSKTERKFDNYNDGKYFPYWLVRKHKISSTVNLKLNEKMDISASWIYSSGIAANSSYEKLSPIIFQEGVDYADPDRDSWTLVKNIPAYHKMDVAINFHKQQKKLRHTLSLGVNNAYARNNPLLISEFEGYLYLSKINLFMPFVQYSLKFN